MSKEIQIKQECCDIWNNLKDKSKMIDYLIESKQQIADLEAKLAESEKLIFTYQNIFKQKPETALEMCEFIKPYEIKLRANELEIDQLKHQLAEQEKEIATLEVMLAENKNELKELQEFKVGDDEYDLTDTDARFSLQCDLLNTEQDKISFAVEHISQFKDFILNNIYLTNNGDEEKVNKFANKIIENIKGK